jgi:heme-degrading monooxygenase HmoA
MIGHRRPIEGEEMAVLMTAQIPGATKEMIDGLRPVLDDITSAKGFIVHANGPSPGGWRVTEMWDTQADFEAWFESSVKPAFPEGAPMPSITFEELNDVVKA